ALYTSARKARVRSLASRWNSTDFRRASRAWESLSDSGAPARSDAGPAAGRAAEGSAAETGEGGSAAMATGAARAITAENTDNGSDMARRGNVRVPGIDALHPESGRGLINKIRLKSQCNFASSVFRPLRKGRRFPGEGGI